MKKTLSVILVAVMLLSTLVSLVVPAAAADGEGNWKTVHWGPNAEELKKHPNDTKIPPLPGYQYTDEGFTTIAPNYDNYNPKYSIVSKDTYSLADFTMTIRVTDYSIVGDNWLSFSIWDRDNGMGQGYSSGAYGYGWSSLIRDGNSDYAFDILFEYNMAKARFDDNGAFEHIGTVAGFVEADDSEEKKTSLNCELTFAVKNNVISINGHDLSEASTNILKKQFPNGLAYIGITVHSSDASGAHKPTITILDVNGEKPTGNDSAEPEDRQRIIGEMRDSSTVPANTPALLFDASFGDENSIAANDSMPEAGNCRIGYSSDNKNFLVTADAYGHSAHFVVKDEITYNAADFPMVAFLFKNLCTCGLLEDETACEGCMETEGIKLRYCAGETTAPNDACMTDMVPVNVNPVDENGDYVNTNEHYLLAYAYVEDPENYVGRIHAMRADMVTYANYNVEGKNQYEIVWAGVFAGGSDLINYVYNNNYGIKNLAEYLVLDQYLDPKDVPGGYEPPEETTSVPTETTTEGKTTVAETEGTTAKVESTTAAVTDDGKGGCGSVVSMGAIAIVTVVAGTGIVTFKKKKED